MYFNNLTVLKFTLSWVFLICPYFLSAQEIHNPHSVKPVRKDEVMFKKTLWFRVDLRHKVNAPLFAQNQEITRTLIQAVKRGIVKAYHNDSLSRAISLKEFNERLAIPQATDEDPIEAELRQQEDLEWGEEAEETPSEEYLPRQLYFLDIKEDYMFNKRTSQMYHDIMAINLLIPASQTSTGVEKIVAAFSYKELMENVFPNKSYGAWINFQNTAQSKSLADAFRLRLFSGDLIKYENPRGNTIEDIYGVGKMSLYKAQEYIYKLIEFEANLWSH